LQELGLRVSGALGDAPSWLVGGVVRDALLGRELPDIDIAVDGDVAQAARRLADEFGGAPFSLSDRFGCWRVTISGGDGRGAESLQHSEPLQLDVCALRGGTIEADLALRDFTVNAIAYSCAGAGELIDSVGGVGDLDGGVLRVVADSAIDDDPLRMLRAARI